jgi:hypothetical protein
MRLASLVVVLLAACGGDDIGPIDPAHARYSDRICQVDPPSPDFRLRHAPTDLDVPGFNDPTSQDILVSIAFPCTRTEGGAYAFQMPWEACAPETDEQGKTFRFDACPGVADGLGLNCIPYHDERFGWTYVEELRAVRFASGPMPPPGACVTAQYLLR